MTIVRILPEYFEYFTVETNPRRTYSADGFDAVSGTYSTVTGNVPLFARTSPSDKDSRVLSPFLENSAKEGGDDVDGLYADARRQAVVNGNNFDTCQELLSTINSRGPSQRKQQTLEIVRFETPFFFNKDFARKRIIRELLYPHYRDVCPSMQWAYSNYHTLNFFTGSNEDGTEPVPTDSVLMYANTNAGSGLSASGSVSGNIYLPTNGVSFDFRINPRYTTPNAGEQWRPGTLFHLPGVYAVSLLSGTHKDKNGFLDGYRLALQVLSGTDTEPSQIVGEGSGIFLSDDNALTRNHWHHVVIRWGTNAINDGTGSFIVDGVNRGNFVIPSASLATALNQSPDVLFVGNWYSGSVVSSSLFFTTNAATREGLVELTTVPTVDGPPTADYEFTHPLSAEVHELRIWNKFINNDELFSGSTTSVVDDIDDLMFYVPPFFTPESPFRTEVDGIGGVLQTPFFAINGRTDDPFNVSLSFGVGGHYLNLENFTRDFARSNYPRAYALTASQITETSVVKTANDFFYSTGSIRKRNLTVLPCDDGQFTPDYRLLETGTIVQVPDSSSLNYKYTNDLGVYDPTLISLTELIPDKTWYQTLTNESGTLFGNVVGATPDNPGVDPGEVLAVYQRTRDNSSNQIVIFDASNVFYGNRINPGTFKLVDPAMTGSGGRVKMTLKDNGFGSLYRADAETAHPTWTNIGNVLYDEGIVVVKSPGLPFFGKEAYELEFEGLRNIHTFKVRIPAAAGQINSSSNPAYVPASASLDANEFDKDFVYITGINLHDENMNVVMKTTLAQPVVKRSGDKIVFKPGMDF